MTIEEGNKLWKKLRPLLLKDKHITLDFIGIKSMSAPFLNESINKIAMISSVDEICENLRFINVSDHVKMLLEHYLNSSINKYINDNCFN
jgi:hypothetical protein